jgi:CRP-like cAMP-binding protein
MQLTDLMKGIELFHGLNQTQLQRLADISQQETYNEGEVIVAIDSPGSEMYIITEGQVEIDASPESTARRALVYLGEGQIFGEMALLDGGPRSATVSSAQDGTIVYKLSREAFLSLCQQDTALGYAMMRNIALDLSFKLRHYNLNIP